MWHSQNNLPSPGSVYFIRPLCPLLSAHLYRTDIIRFRCIIYAHFIA